MSIAVVTGASSGMGREFVKQISRNYKGIQEIWVAARRKERLDALKEEINMPLRIFAGDITAVSYTHLGQRILSSGVNGTK